MDKIIANIVPQGVPRFKREETKWFEFEYDCSNGVRSAEIRDAAREQIVSENFIDRDIFEDYWEVGAIQIVRRRDTE